MPNRLELPSRPRPSPSTDAPDAVRRRGLAALVAAGGLAGLGLGGCANAPLGPRHHDVSLERLLASMAERFPMKRPVWDGLDLTLGLPTLSLRPAENRLATVLDVSADERMLTRRQYKGTLGFSSGLRYEASDRSVRLSEVRIEQFQVDALSRLLGSQASRLGAWVTQDLLENLSVYRLPPSVVELTELLGVRPDGLQVQPQGLRILLVPLKA
jgi:hypothetical protein